MTAMILESGIHLADLTQQDVGRRVCYTAPHGMHSFGTLSSWNAHYVFVRFNRGRTAAACLPHQVRFLRDEPVNGYEEGATCYWETHVDVYLDEDPFLTGKISRRDME